jgi:hypothetical protein
MKLSANIQRTPRPINLEDKSKIYRAVIALSQRALRIRIRSSLYLGTFMIRKVRILGSTVVPIQRTICAVQALRTEV